MKERPLTRLIVLSVSLILPSVLVPLIFVLGPSLISAQRWSPMASCRCGRHLRPPSQAPLFDGVPLPPPESLAPSPPPKATDSTRTTHNPLREEFWALPA
jgi:hypothetical protein